MIIISDMFGELDSIINALQHFRYRKHQVMLLHVMAEEELTFPFEKWTNFRCLEQRAWQQQLDPRAIRAAYLDRVGQFVRGLDLECGRMQIDYVPMNTKTPYDVALANYLVNRRA